MKNARTATPTSATPPPTSSDARDRVNTPRCDAAREPSRTMYRKFRYAQRRCRCAARSSTMSAEDVLDWVARRKLAAPITFERRGLVRSLVVEDGQIVWASSQSPRRAARRDPGPQSGLVAERALADALEARAETGVPLGKVLLMSGLITEPDLVEILATKIRETVTDVITWHDGQFDVVPRTQPPATGVNAQLLDRGLPDRRPPPRRAHGRDHEHPRRRRRHVLRAAGATPPTGRASATSSTPRRSWALAGDRNTAADIAAAFAGERFATYDKLVEMVAGRPARHRSPPARAHELRGRARGGCARPAAPGRSRRRARDGEPGAASRSERSRGAQDVRADRARARRRDREAAARAPPRAEEAARCHARARSSSACRPPRSSSRGRVDGRWDLLSLIESASVREAEALLAFAHLAEVGVVELG